MAGLEDILGAGDAVKQLFLWGVLQQVIGQAFGPYLTNLMSLVNTAHPDVPLSPADAAQAANRSFLTDAGAAGEAAKAGVDAGRFAVLRHLAGDAPGPQQLAAALIRGLIPADGTGPDAVTYQQGIAEGNLGDKWGPMLRQLAEQLLSPADAADAAVRNFLDPAAAAEAAAKSGVPADVFQIMTHLAGDAPAPGQLAEALRRGLIPADGTGPDSISFSQGIAEGRLADKWTPVIHGLAAEWPTPADALAATLEGQVTHDEGLALYERFGGDPAYFEVLFNTRGSAPTPLEALEMANRGIIPWDGTGPQAVSYHQAFLEGPWRDKWLDAYRKLGEYVPPPETVRSLLEQGAIDQTQAAQFWAQSGMSPETVKAYLQAALFNNLAATRGLTASAVLDMYYAQLVSGADARKLLDLFQVPASNADLLLAYVDMRRSITEVNTAVTRIQALFAARKIGSSVARDALQRLKVPPASIDSIITTWEVEASVSVKTLTESQIVDAWAEAVFSEDEAMAELTAIGYTPYDAWALLSVKNKGPLPNKPARIVAAPLGAVIPGVT